MAAFCPTLIAVAPRAFTRSTDESSPAVMPTVTFAALGCVALFDGP